MRGKVGACGFSYTNNMNGPTVVYRLRPVFKLAEDIELPKCMYRMKNIQGSFSNCTYEEFATCYRSQQTEDSTNQLVTEKNFLDSKGLPYPWSEALRQAILCYERKSINPEVAALENRQEAILEQLARLKRQIEGLREELRMPLAPSNEDVCKKAVESVQDSSVFQNSFHDMVINANPQYPPFSLLALKSLWGAKIKFRISTHVHSTIKEVPDIVNQFIGDDMSSSGDRYSANVVVTLVWKDVSSYPELILSPIKHTAIKGEVNILRYLLRLVPSQHLCDAQDAVKSTEVDAILDNCHRLISSKTVKEQQAFVRKLNGKLGKSSWLMGDGPSIADVAAWSLLQQPYYRQEFPNNVQKWFQRCSSQFGKDSTPQTHTLRVENMSCGQKQNSVSKVVEVLKQPKGKNDLFRLLHDLDIEFTNHTHPEVFTVEAMMKHVHHLPGLHTKNLFLKDRKKLYLLSALHDREIKLSEVAKKIGAKDLRFEDESVMFNVLGVKQGCVTPLALINDHNKLVTFVCDSELLISSEKYVYCHPLVNCATVGIKTHDLKKFTQYTGQKVIEITF